MSSTPPTPETNSLLGHLDAQRRHVLGILEGLDEDGLRRTVLPSGWNCLGLLQHLALDDERFWFQAVGPYPRILDTGCDYAAVGSVAARRVS